MLKIALRRRSHEDVLEHIEELEQELGLAPEDEEPAAPRQLYAVPEPLTKLAWVLDPSGGLVPQKRPEPIARAYSSAASSAYMPSRDAEWAVIRRAAGEGFPCR